MSTYYVSTTGSDSNPGSLGYPWASFSHANAQVAPGDTVIFEDGVYTAGVDYFALLNVSGTAGAYITYKARNIGGAILDGQSNYTNMGLSIWANYLNIEGFEIRNLAGTAIATGEAHNHVNFRYLWIHHIGRICTTTSFGLDGVYLHQASYFFFDRCKFNDIGRLRVADGCPSDTGTGLDQGLYLDGCSYITAQNCIFYHIGNGFALQIYSSGSLTSDHISFINNTCNNNNFAHYAGHIILWSNMNNVLIVNNILKGHGQYAMQIYQGEGYVYSANIIANNIYYGGNNIFYVGTTTGITLSSNTNQDPRFVNEASYNYNLLSASPARDAGYATGLTYDYANNPRVGTMDIGAYEYVSGVTTTTTTTTTPTTTTTTTHPTTTTTTTHATTTTTTTRPITTTTTSTTVALTTTTTSTTRTTTTTTTQPPTTTTTTTRPITTTTTSTTVAPTTTTTTTKHITTTTTTTTVAPTTTTTTTHSTTTTTTTHPPTTTTTTTTQPPTTTSTTTTVAPTITTTSTSTTQPPTTTTSTTTVAPTTTTSTSSTTTSTTTTIPPTTTTSTTRRITTTTTTSTTVYQSTYWNVELSEDVYKNNCPVHFKSTMETYTVHAHTYSSNRSQEDADNKALKEIARNKQAYANKNCSCIPKPLYYNFRVQDSAVKTDCPEGYIGSTVLYVVPAGKYSSTISQAEVDTEAINDLNTNKQTYAKNCGKCRKPRVKKC